MRIAVGMKSSSRKSSSVVGIGIVMEDRNDDMLMSLTSR